MRPRVREPPQVGDAAIGARRQRPVEGRAAGEVVGDAERTLEDFRARCRGAELGEPLFEKRRAERDVLGPANRPIAGGQVLDTFANPDVRSISTISRSTRRPGAWQTRLSRSWRSIDLENVADQRRFTMRRQSGGGFGVRRPAENVGTEIVPHDAGEQPASAPSPYSGWRARE